ncbi:ATP-binding protein [Solemya velum gill symbiont]|uniref:ATP-binding protein n=1 Tax=Solemya velum gill symbiont TaxID=2340 RepID=UPI00099699D6|nr:ATP-binding protein [Solemya velum gill symbiont]OOY53380.1 hypothetical protein BOV97_03460 [Solemya velum gill symbiont]OOY55806.1 hypothetical protein BOV99_06800 [Solemya velum gill symbiont]OOY58161.1 hypothetical protein BOW00_02250 [Solemya velum gill symbiont]OOY61810.1 hypothetical protein BOW02_00095 [Solemya velum gill symbiont]OOY63661.1 hypothetical protein BOW04_01355 [Solemya velum gill symbiont]
MNSIHARLLLAATAVLLLFVVITAWVMQRADQERLLVAVDTRLQGLVYGVLGATEVSDRGEILVDRFSLPDSSLAQAGSGRYVVIQDAQGRIVWKSDSVIDQLPPLQTPTVGEWLKIQDGDYIGSGLGVRWYVDDNPHRLTLWALESASMSRSESEVFATTLVIWLGLLSLLLLAILYLVLRWAAAPINRLGRAVDEVRSGERREIVAAMPKELETVKAAINRLLKHERGRQSHYRNSLGDLAHSLKTPLAVLSNDAHAANDESRIEQLQRIEEILSYHLTRATSSETTAFAEPLAISSLLRRLCDSLQRVYRDKGVTVSLNCTEGLLASCDEKLFFEVAGNLLDNAFKWTESSVTVRCEKQGGSMIAIVITDDGPGFGESDPSIYLQRGVRADERVAGQGIGLSVAQLLVTEAGGELKLENAPAGGARVSLFLPAVSQN